MSEPAKPEPKPSEKFRAAMTQIFRVPKAEIVRLEAEAKEQRKARRESR